MKRIRREYGVEIDGIACPNLKAGSGRITGENRKDIGRGKRKESMTLIDNVLPTNQLGTHTTQHY
jgi:hypothetical protein